MKKECHCIIRHANTPAERNYVTKCLERARSQGDNPGIKIYLAMLDNRDCPANIKQGRKALRLVMTDEQLYQHRMTHDKMNSYWLNDAKGIPVSRVCDDCIDAVKAKYRPEIFGEGGRYEDVVEEAIEDEDDPWRDE